MKRFFILSVVMWCSGSPVNGSCIIQMTPPSVVVRFGDSFSFNCSTPSDDMESIGVESQHKNAREYKISYVVLKIPVDGWDVTPLCFLNLNNGDQCSQTLPVTVYKMPDSVSISERGPVVEGEKYRMRCDVVNVAPVRNLSVLWRKGNETIYTETFKNPSLSPVNATSSLFNVTAQRGDDGMEIWCEAKLDFRPPVQSASRKVVVLYSPTFTEPENVTLEISAGTTFMLDCDATGRPQPVYSWDFPHSMQQTNQNENTPTLTPSIQLPGIYRCTASNSQGSRVKYFTVTAATRNYTTLLAVVGGFVLLGAALFIAGSFFVTPEGTFALNRGSYLRGQPTSSGPV